MASEAQTPPPATGDWDISDLTVYNDISITVNGSIMVRSGGKLALTNVDLDLNGTGNKNFTVFPGGILTLEGGQVIDGGDRYDVDVWSMSIINGTTFDGINRITVRSWGTKVTNCTVKNTGDVGIYITPEPTSRPDYPVTIADNTVTNTFLGGIIAQIGEYVGERQRIHIIGNNVSITRSNAITVEVIADMAEVLVEDNIVRNSGGVGIGLDAACSDLVVYFDGNDVDTTGMNGIDIRMGASFLDFQGIDNLRSVKSQGIGVFVWNTLGWWVKPLFSNWTVTGHNNGAITLRYVKSATLADSHLDNPIATDEIVCVETDLDIFRTTFDRSNCRVSYSTDTITSWRFLDLTFHWQSGAPVASRDIELYDDLGGYINIYPTDNNGWWDNITVWDWKLTYSRATTRPHVTPHVVGPTQDLVGPNIDMDRDRNETVTIADTIKPALDITAPTGDILQNITTLYIEGTASDEHSGMAMVQVSFDPEPDWDLKAWTDAIGNSSWSLVINDLPDGVLTIYVRAFDVANFPGGAAATRVGPKVTVDTTAPTITIISPVELETGTYLTNLPSVTVRGTVSSDVTSLTIDGTPIVPTLGEFTLPWGLSPGANLVEVVATDAAGNVARRTLATTYDNTAPSIGIDSPPDGSVINVTTIDIVGQIGEMPWKVSLLLNGVPLSFTPDVGLFAQVVTGLVPGVNTITLTGEDEAGNVASVEIDVIVDLVPPSLDVVEPAEGTVTRDLSIEVMGTVETGAAVWVNGVAATVTLGTFTTTYDLASGMNVITIEAMDPAGNRISEERTVTLDDVAPAVAVTFPTDGHLTNLATLEVVGTLEDGATLTVNGAQADIVAGVFTHQIDLVEGENTITLHAIDAVGNTADLVITVTSDTIRPYLSVDGLVDGRLKARTNDFTLSGNTESGATLTFVLSGTTVIGTVAADGTFTQTFTIETGRTDLRIFTRDAAGNEETAEAVIVLSAPSTGDDEPAIPAATVVAAAGATSIVVMAAMATFEVTRYSLILLLLPLYARIRGKAVLDNKTRYALHGLIMENPGMHYNEIIREFGLTNGVAAYHLDVLEREGFLRTIRDGTLKRFYSSTTKVPMGFKLTPEEMRERILDVVAESPGIAQKEIVDQIGIGRTLAGYHLKTLVKDGYLEAKRKGRFTVYLPTRKRRFT
jgi:DNA-binding MarR family transcriptional regulator